MTAFARERRVPSARIVSALILMLSVLGWFGAQRAQAAGSPFVNSVSAGSLPQNGLSKDSFDINGSACDSKGSCLSVGNYYDVSYYQQGLIVPITNGIAGAGVESPLPANAGANPDASLAAVSCWAAGSCVAVGYYYDRNNDQQAFVVPITNGVPGAAQEVTLPAGAGTNPYAELESVSCAPSGSCVTVGRYDGSGSDYHALVVPINDGVAAPGVEASLPANQASYQDAELYAVSCQASGSCDAVGFYYDKTGAYNSLVVPITGGVPAAGTEVSAPAGTQYSYLEYVSCPPSGTCSAVGYDENAAGNWVDVAVPITGGVPGSGTDTTLPAGASSSAYGDLYGISCQSSGWCAAVGYYQDNTSAYQAYVLPIDNGVPSTAVEVSLPADAYTVTGRQYAGLYGVSCPASGPCLAAGFYINSSADYVGMTVSFDGGNVGSAVETPSPADAATSSSAADAYYLGVACATYSCAATGSYANASSLDLPYVLDAQGPLTVGTSSLAAGTLGAPYSATLSAAGAWGSYSWSVASGSLPAGLSLNPQTGVISGVPTASGTSTFTVAVTGTGALPQTATQTLSITVPAQVVTTPTTTTPTTPTTPVVPAKVATPRPHVRVLSVKRLKNGRLSVRLRCSGRECRGNVKVELRSVRIIKHGKRRVRRHIVTVIANVHYSLAAGHVRTVRVALRQSGRRALTKARHRRLAVTVVASVRGGKGSSKHTTI